MSENYCPHCMQPAAGAKCPHCGGDMNWRGQKGIDLPVGTVLTGGNGLRTYQIGAARGKGGFGITYVAREINSGRRMAVKEYFPTRCAFRAGNEVDVQTMSGQEDVFRAGMNSFLDEGRMLLSQDDLPSVVHVIDYFQANGTAYLVMEYLDGVALHTQMIRMGGRIPVSELMPRLAPLTRDIGQLHRRGVLHRDISPDNIMWMADGTLKLLDFGSARSMENGKSMTVLMKHGFSPIEQYRSKGQGPYTDIYALAATIYYCVTGVIPPAAVERLDEDALQSPTALGAALTVDQETALLWALSLQPNARPQSMEEFASMLYKDSPAPIPQNPIQPGPVYGNPPAQPVNTSYQYTYTGQGQQGQTSGQYGGQTSSQYGGQTSGQYGGQTSVQYGSQYGAPGPQGQSGGTSGGGGKKKLPIFIGAGAAVALLVVVVIAVLNGGSPDPVPTYTLPPIQTSTPSVPSPTLPPIHSPTLPPVPDTAPPQNNIGVIDGFQYEIVGQDHVVLTGYESGAKFNYMPDYVDDLPITEIASGAFSGADTGMLVNLPLHLETIGANAFLNCTGLEYVYAYSNIVTQSSSFSGCSDLWLVAVLNNNMSTSGWKLPGGVNLYYYGMETGAGTLTDIEWDGNMLLGETDSGAVVLLGVDPGTWTVALDGVDWIYSEALYEPPYNVELGEETMFPYEMYSDVNVWSAPEGSLADMWLLTCEVANAVNASRSVTAPRIKPDLDLVMAAVVRAEELTQYYSSSERPDGTEWYTVVREREIDYGYLGGNTGYQDSLSLIHSEVPGAVAGKRAAALTAEQSESYAGEYFTMIGIAYCLDGDGDYCYQSFVVIP